MSIELMFLVIYMQNANIGINFTSIPIDGNLSQVEIGLVRRCVARARDDSLYSNLTTNVLVCSYLTIFHFLCSLIFYRNVPYQTFSCDPSLIVSLQKLLQLETTRRKTTNYFSSIVA